MKSLAGRIALHVLLPLLAGCYIYYVFRPDVAFIRWFTERPPQKPYEQLSREMKWLVYSGPDFCWAYSLASALYIWEAWKGNRRRIFPFLVTGILVVSEAVQGVLLPGFTFDWPDLVAVIAAAVMSVMIVRKKGK